MASGERRSQGLAALGCPTPLPHTVHPSPVPHPALAPFPDGHSFRLAADRSGEEADQRPGGARLSLETKTDTERDGGQLRL